MIPDFLSNYGSFKCGDFSLLDAVAVTGVATGNGNPVASDFRLLGVMISPPSLSLTAPKLFVVLFN